MPNAPQEDRRNQDSTPWIVDAPTGDWVAPAADNRSITWTNSSLSSPFIHTNDIRGSIDSISNGISTTTSPSFEPCESVEETISTRYAPIPTELLESYKQEGKRIYIRKLKQEIRHLIHSALVYSLANEGDDIFINFQDKISFVIDGSDIPNNYSKELIGLALNLNKKGRGKFKYTIGELLEEDLQTVEEVFHEFSDWSFHIYSQEGSIEIEQRQSIENEFFGRTS